MRNLVIGVVVVGVAIAFLNITKPPKNWRNKNPLNIKEGNNWDGEAKANLDPIFEEYKTHEYGFRAGYKLLSNYMDIYGLKTVEQILYRFAPAGSENPHIENYINYVAKHLEVARDDRITKEHLPVMMLWMSRFEGARGLYSYNIDQVLAGVALA